MTKDYDTLILDTLKDGAKRPCQLERLLVKSGTMSRLTLRKHLNNLVENKKVDCDKSRKEKDGIVTYYLPSTKDENYSELNDVVEKLRSEKAFLREPTINEVATCLGETPESIREKLYKTADMTGWHEQIPEEAKNEAGNAIVLATWLKWSCKGEENRYLQAKAKAAVHQTHDSRILARAQRIVDEKPMMVPEIAVQMDWPSETKRAWQNVFGGDMPELPKLGDQWRDEAIRLELRKAVEHGAEGSRFRDNEEVHWRQPEES